MKKTLSVILALVMVFSAFSVMAVAEEPTFTYEVISEEAKTCKITGATADAPALNIPAEIDGYTVIAIANNAFEVNVNATAITIPDSVTSIGQYAFNKTAYYKDSANWESGVLYIGKFLISAKGNIEGEYTVKDGTLVIADIAFRNCKKLTKVTLPEGLTHIGMIAFRDCELLAEVVLPTTLKVIGAYAFTGCETLSGVVLPDGLVEMGKYSFNGTGLTEIAIPASVEIIGDYAFANSKSLAKIEVAPENENYSSSTGLLLDKEQTTILYCPNAVDYETAVLPVTVTIIGNGAFEGAPVEEIVLPETITKIGDAAFANCENLTKITISPSVTEIGEDAFFGCAEGFVIEAEADSYAYKYAEENGYLPVEQEIVLGDVTGDGALSALDVRYILQYIADLREFEEAQIIAADVDKNGEISALDVRWVLQAIAGMRTL